MTDRAYREALDAALREYERALADQAALETRIAQLRQTIGTLTKLCGYEPTVPWGLTDACRTALRCAGKPLTAVEVRDRLAGTGFDLDRYANALAAVHTVLKRLEQSGEAALVPADETTRTAYEFLRSGVIASRTGSRAEIAPATPSPQRPRRRKPRTRTR
ncbi:MAG: hypothetical protein R2752_22685 [Vicinamibacterales bacterium]